MTQPEAAAITLYKAGRCPYCVAAARFLREVKKVELTEIDLSGDDEGRMALIARAGGQRTVPQIWIGATHIGGYDVLRALDRDGQLDPLIWGA